MNYYILPKNTIDFDFSPTKKFNNTISPSILNQLTYIKKQITDLLVSSEFDFDTIYNIINPYFFLGNCVTGSLLSVSKVKPDSNIFFELMEIFQTFNLSEIIDNIKSDNKTILHITNNYNSTAYLLNMLREDSGDEFSTVTCEEFKQNVIHAAYNNKMFDVIICEFDLATYKNPMEYELIMNKLLSYLTMHQTINGICIVKIGDMFNYNVVEIIYILSCLYEKICVAKPTTCDSIDETCYLICKGLTSQTNKCKLSNSLNYWLNKEIPYYFKNKIEEINAILGQQQLETLTQIINLLVSKNKEDKIENIKRVNIQKCIQWCEKNKLPHNKFTEKTNIFLNQPK